MSSLPARVVYVYQCSHCCQPFTLDDVLRKPHGEKYDAATNTIKRYAVHLDCYQEMVRRAEIEVRMDSAVQPSGRRNVKTRKGWVQR